MRVPSYRIGPLLLTALVAACAGRAAAPVPGNGPGPASIDTAAATTAASENRLDGPVRVVFDWSLQEREGRFSGQGVTRVAPPDRARLDLFGPRGEGYLSAAFIGGEVLLPRNVQSAPLPPPELLWSALGVFQPPPGATLVATRNAAPRLTLEYTAADQRWRYDFENGTLRSVEWTAPGNNRRTVVLEGSSDHGLPARAVYRDWPAFVELRMNLKEASSVDGFPPDTWRVGGP